MGHNSNHSGIIFASSLSNLQMPFTFNELSVPEIERETNFGVAYFLTFSAAALKKPDIRPLVPTERGKTREKREKKSFLV